MRSARACLIVPAATAVSRSAFTEATTAAETVSYGTPLSVATSLSEPPVFAYASSSLIHGSMAL